MYWHSKLSNCDRYVTYDIHLAQFSHLWSEHLMIVAVIVYCFIVSRIVYFV